MFKTRSFGEVADNLPGVVAMALTFTPDSWRSFVARVAERRS